MKIEREYDFDDVKQSSESQWGYPDSINLFRPL
jgi:hypothetical protein